MPTFRPSNPRAIANSLPKLELYETVIMHGSRQSSRRGWPVSCDERGTSYLLSASFLILPPSPRFAGRGDGSEGPSSPHLRVLTQPGSPFRGSSPCSILMIYRPRLVAVMATIACLSPSVGVPPRARSFPNVRTNSCLVLSRRAPSLLSEKIQQVSMVSDTPS